MADSVIDALCSTAAGRAEACGHQLRPWIAVPGEPGNPDTARATACLRCGRVAYARVEAGIQGATGSALSEPCDGLP